MRYFKYKHTNKTINTALSAQYKALTHEGKRILHQQRRWRKFSNIVAVIIFVSCVAGGICLISLIPQPDNLAAAIFAFIGKVLLSPVLAMVSAFLTFGLTSPLWKKVESFHLPTWKKEILSKACSHLREYYGLQEPYIVTKCFDATDKAFQHHDVCIFVARDELRITTDLARGFLYGERDLGCYAFKRHEITLSKQQDGRHLVVELKTDNAVFLLGYRAKGFIEKHFLTT